ncbi:flagellar protein FlaG [Paenibacillus bouchesdurhonensis]|uniref:flagellar protein FlaG n=1 Tax=Paenibacillus bouchesdurhonensis TaxID=1870990 RepID=UPI000DA5F43C|nr:flagellar protein FlaG [Paenibacillus bouchesdurhonensis]
MNINPIGKESPVHHFRGAMARINSDELAQTSLATRSLDYKSLTDEEKLSLEEEIKKLNHSIASSGKHLQFKYNEDAAQLYVEIIDLETKEVLSSLPPEFLVDLSIKMKELVGMFFDEKI